MEYIEAKTIVRRCKPNWNYLLFEYAMDIYRGCSHGCIYCYARSNYYEKTNQFECVRAKKDALLIIRDELRKKTKTGVVLVGGVSDSYNPKEKELLLTRNALELINAFDFGACIITKSNLVTRDMDVLLDIKEHSPSSVNFSITCSSEELSKRIEPHAPTTKERFEALESLAKNNITTGVMMDPMIPFITDTKENVQEMVKKAKNYGANYIYLSTQVTMADVQRDYFLCEAEKLYPGISEKFLERYKNYYRCYSFDSKKLWNTFVEACEKEKISYDMKAVNQRLRVGYQTHLPI